MAAVCACGLAVRPPQGLLLLAGTVLGSLGLILGGQRVLQQQQPPLNPSVGVADLWQHYRWGWDPSTRREAALLLAAADLESPQRRQRLLQGQAWGNSPITAAVLLHQATIATHLGQRADAAARWHALLHRFPKSPFSADAAYRLGATDPALSDWLLTTHPAHPAALERAVEQRQAVHLAAWGPGHPRAEAVIRAACSSKANTNTAHRQQLALALASLGDGQGGLDCLEGATPAPATAVTIGRSLLRGDPAQRQRGESLLVAAARSASPTVNSTSLEAARLLSEPLKPDGALLAQLPETLQQRSADVAAAQVRLGQRNALEVLTRWPDHPASWQLQWDRARSHLLAGHWTDAEALLMAIPTEHLPEPLAARQRFWLGLSQAKQGRDHDAKTHWRTLIQQHPPGYYSWRASVRLGEDDLPPLSRGRQITPASATDTEALHSGDTLVDSLWRLGLRRDAWEIWRSQHTQRLDPQVLVAEPTPNARIVKGRLLLAINDTWGGLAELWRASLRQTGDSCSSRRWLHQLQHPLPLEPSFDQAAERLQVHEALLRAIAKQESRYSPGVRSPVGAQGLMQLMPSTAEELAGQELSEDTLNDPRTNTQLGARYLQQLLRQWNGNPWLTVASYNAGPGAAGGWRSDELHHDPELWTERIPFPETRLYTKKVLGNLWAYLQTQKERCQNAPPFKGS